MISLCLCVLHNNTAIDARNSVFNIKFTQKHQILYAKPAVNRKINFKVPLLGRMKTYAKYCGGLQTGSVVRLVGIEYKHSDAFNEAFDSIFQKIATYLSQINRK